MKSRQREPYLPGEIIENKYRLQHPIGEGGMGTVWVAHNVVLDVPVAIKLISLHDTSARSSERLLQEARAAARLGHPAIVRVFDFGRTRRGDPFVVMELIRGETLSTLVEDEQRLPAIRAVQLMLPIADALGVAHAKGIIHRDVKPENVILSRDEAGRIQPKLLDFGIASMVETNQRLTLEGTVLGTPDYMSPEQARGEGVLDQRTDVWSFSVMLYELLTGHLPFRGKNYNALLWSIINQQPTPITEFAAGDMHLWGVIERGLAKEPGDRWETIRVMGEALALWLYERGVREDVCAASLKTNWLEGGLTGVRIEVSSAPPSARSDWSDGAGLHATPAPPRPAKLPFLESGFFHLRAERQAGIGAAAALELESAPHRLNRKRLAFAVLGGALLAGLLVWLGSARSPAEATGPAPSSRAAVTALAPTPTARRAPDPKPAPQASAVESASAAPLTTKAVAHVDGTRKRTSQARAPVVTGAEQASAPAHAAPAPQKEPDFGF